MYVYADNAATTALSQTALEAMMPCFQEEYANPSSLHTPGQRAAEKLAQKGGLMGRLAGSVDGLKKLIYNKYLAGKTQDQRDQLAAELVARNQGFLMEKAAELAKKNGVNVQVKDISVRKI